VNKLREYVKQMMIRKLAIMDGMTMGVILVMLNLARELLKHSLTYRSIWCESFEESSSEKYDNCIKPWRHHHPYFDCRFLWALFKI
jgi:hypothetical protein